MAFEQTRLPDSVDAIDSGGRPYLGPVHPWVALEHETIALAPRATLHLRQNIFGIWVPDGTAPYTPK